MSRLKYTYHQEIPSILRIDDLFDSKIKEDDETISDRIKTATFLKDLKNGCKYFQKNPNHHFFPFKGMSISNGDRYIQITEIQDSWNSDSPPQYHLVREIHKQGNHKFIEFTDLYECKYCGIYCKSRNSHHIPSKIWNRLNNLIIRGEYQVGKMLPLSIKV
tara:strand:- start:140 stop:622 length:483 start_codon:yes stop_codon:yes gene_type:complete